MQLSALTTRNPSQYHISIDSNIETLLQSPRFNHLKYSRRSLDHGIGDSLLERHSKAKAQIAESRFIAKAKELQEMREAPSIQHGSIKKFNHKSQTEIKLLVDSIPKTTKKKAGEKSTHIEAIRPQDVIEIPDISVIKEILTRVVPVEKQEEIHRNYPQGQED